MPFHRGRSMGRGVEEAGGPRFLGPQVEWSTECDVVDLTNGTSFSFETFVALVSWKVKGWLTVTQLTRSQTVDLRPEPGRAGGEAGKQDLSTQSSTASDISNPRSLPYYEVPWSLITTWPRSKVEVRCRQVECPCQDRSPPSLTLQSLLLHRSLPLVISSMSFLLLF